MSEAGSNATSPQLLIAERQAARLHGEHMARLRAIRAECERLGVVRLSIEQLDQVLPPVRCARTRARKRGR